MVVNEADDRWAHFGALWPRTWSKLYKLSGHAAWLLCFTETTAEMESLHWQMWTALQMHLEQQWWKWLGWTPFVPGLSVSSSAHT